MAFASSINSIANTTTNTTNTTSATTSNDSTTTSTRSNAILDKDAFLKLLLVEMQHQDPTDPMDSEKMLTQTSQLAALEMQQNTNTTMEKMVETMNLLSEAMTSNSNLSAVNALGKTAIINESTFPLNSANDVIDITINLPKETANGATFEILNSENKVIRTIKVEKDALKLGTNKIRWNGKNDDGVFAGAGKYTMKVSYLDVDGGTSTSAYGAYPIESVRFTNGKVELQIGGQYVGFDQIRELS